DDMIHWTDHGVAFTLADTDWAKDCGALYAPDCAYRNGKYYLYYCVPDGRCGVAESESPTGPFRDIGPMANVHGIDPAVLIDDGFKRKDRLRPVGASAAPGEVLHPCAVAEELFYERRRAGAGVQCVPCVLPDAPKDGVLRNRQLVVLRESAAWLDRGDTRLRLRQGKSRRLAHNVRRARADRGAVASALLELLAGEDQVAEGALTPYRVAPKRKRVAEMRRVRRLAQDVLAPKGVFGDVERLSLDN
ncbi:MAG: family 43 glycosylhydrolase, partial [Kiritimatiellae bacterium]|nr:family 43 glycosylhydrolase [Kiritimatiellia bacterium]